MTVSSFILAVKILLENQVYSLLAWFKLLNFFCLVLLERNSALLALDQGRMNCICKRQYKLPPSKMQRNFNEITLRHGCSSVNLEHIFRTLFLRTPLEDHFRKPDLTNWIANKRNDKRFNNRGYSLFLLMGIFLKHLWLIPNISKWRDCKIFTKVVPSQTPSRSSHWRCSVKKVFWKIWEISQENICVEFSFK